jgi:hypothetical protein
MILRELFYFDKDTKAVSDDMRYEGYRDSLMPMKRKDTRKTRLTLEQIGELRRASEQHILEQEKELGFIEQMYKTPEQPPT